MARLDVYPVVVAAETGAPPKSSAIVLSVHGATAGPARQARRCFVSSTRWGVWSCMAVRAVLMGATPRGSSAYHQCNVMKK